jgi:hypothetical protein
MINQKRILFDQNFLDNQHKVIADKDLNLQLNEIQLFLCYSKTIFHNCFAKYIKKFVYKSF